MNGQGNLQHSVGDELGAAVQADLAADRGEPQAPEMLVSDEEAYQEAGDSAKDETGTTTNPTTEANADDALEADERPDPKSLSDKALTHICEKGFGKIKVDVEAYRPYLLEAKRRYTQPGRRVPVEGTPTWTEWIVRCTGYSIRAIQYWLEEKEDGKGKKKGSARLGEKNALGSGTQTSATEASTDSAITTAPLTSENPTSRPADPAVRIGAVDEDELARRRQETESALKRVTLAFSRSDSEKFGIYITGLFRPFRSAITEPENAQLVQSQIVLEALRREFEANSQIAA